MRLISDLEMPLAPPNASTRASPLRVEMPPVRCRPSSPRRRGPCRPGGAVPAVVTDVADFTILLRDGISVTSFERSEVSSELLF